MLNQLIESKNHQEENTRKNGFLVATLGVLVAVLLSGWTYSLFAKNFGMGTGDLELSSIIAPVVAAEEAPPQPEPEQQPDRQQTASNNERPTVKEKIATIENSLDKPPRIEDSRALVSRPLKPGEEKLYSEGPENKYRNTSDGIEKGDGIKQPATTSKTDVEEEKAPEVVVKPTPAPEKTPKQVTKISGGVLNGKATYLAKPPYPAAARAMNITGSVSVQVLIDKKGNVVSASVVSGHPLLRSGAENAARQSKFSPTYLTNEPVEVTGVIVYQFKP